jgi:hypothetical protein
LFVLSRAIEVLMAAFSFTAPSTVTAQEPPAFVAHLSCFAPPLLLSTHSGRVSEI